MYYAKYYGQGEGGGNSRWGKINKDLKGGGIKKGKKTEDHYIKNGRKDLKNDLFGL